MNCPNPQCGRVLSCGCELRTSSNGLKGCSVCIQTLSLKGNNPVKTNQPLNSTAPIIQSVTYNKGG